MHFCVLLEPFEFEYENSFDFFEFERGENLWAHLRHGTANIKVNVYILREKKKTTFCKCRSAESCFE